MILDRQIRLKETLSFIQSSSNVKPRAALILGSGLGRFVDHIKVKRDFSFSKIPHFKSTFVKGHKGRLILGEVYDFPLPFFRADSFL